MDDFGNLTPAEKNEILANARLQRHESEQRRRSAIVRGAWHLLFIALFLGTYLRASLQEFQK